MTLLEGSRFLKDLIPVVSGVRLAAVRLMLVGGLLVGFMMFRPEGLWREEPVRPAR
jgi:branched-chain amino acid transport system permease protein